MASAALEERINKIRLQNEEIRRRYEEVEADKKNAAKLDALVEPVPAEDWPERKEPPEFSAPPPKHTNKSKHPIRNNLNNHGPQYYPSSATGGDGKKSHNFADGQGPPPDPKYNFLADSEREEHGEETTRDTERNKGRGKPTRGSFKRRGSGRDWLTKEQWNQQGSPGDSTRPDYEAWRAERNRIDEARISRQRTAEGNWRREWDNDKVHLANAASRRDRVTLEDVTIRQDHGDNEKSYRSPRLVPRSSPQSNTREAYHGSAVSETIKAHGSVHDPEKRIVITTDRSIKVSLNPGSTPPKTSVMSVKVSAPNIAGTGRVGPRQRPRVMYSSNSDVEPPTHDNPIFTRQKSADEKFHGRGCDQTQKGISPKSPHAQRKRDGEPKSPYPRKKDNARIEKAEEMPTKSSNKKDCQKSPYPQKRGNGPSNYPPKSPRVDRRSASTVKNDSVKSPPAKRQLDAEKCDKNSASEMPAAESSNRIQLVAQDDSSAVSNDDRSNELLSNFESFDGNNENSPIEKSSPKQSDDSANMDLEMKEKCIPHKDGQNNSEFVKETIVDDSSTSSVVVQSEENNFTDENKEQSSAESTKNTMEAEKRCELSNQAANEPSTSSVVDENRSFDSPEKSTSTAFGEIRGKASCSRESKDELSSDIDAPSTDNRTMINCSDDSSEFTGNDSGFLELPSNDSINDVSGYCNVVTSDFAETSVDSFQSQTDFVENPPIANNLALEQNIANVRAGNSSMNFGEEVSEVLGDAVIDVGNSSSTQRLSVENDSVDKITAEGVENNLQKLADTATELQQIGKNSATSSIAREGNEDGSNVRENSNDDVRTVELELQRKDIVSSEKSEEIMEKVANPENVQKRLNNDSETVSEASNNIGQRSFDGIIDEVLKNGSINESTSVSVNPNDII